MVLHFTASHRLTIANDLLKSGAGDEARTRDLNLGKVALYQLSYSRILLTSSANLLLLYFITASRLFLRAPDRNEIMEKPNFSVKPFVCAPSLLTLSNLNQSIPPRSRICGHASFM